MESHSLKNVKWGDFLSVLPSKRPSIHPRPGWLGDSEAWLAGSEAWLASWEAWLAGLEAWLAGLETWLAGLEA